MNVTQSGARPPSARPPRARLPRKTRGLEMSVEIAQVILFLSLPYVGVGILVSPALIFWRVGRFDDAAEGILRFWGESLGPGTSAIAQKLGRAAAR